MLIIKPKYLQERKSYLYNIFPKIWIVYEMLPILDLAQIGTYSKKKYIYINWIIWHSELIIQSIVIFYLFITWKLFTGQYKHIRPLAYGMIFKMFWQFWGIPKELLISVSALPDAGCNVAALIFSHATGSWLWRKIIFNFFSSEITIKSNDSWHHINNLLLVDKIVWFYCLSDGL